MFVPHARTKDENGDVATIGVSDDLVKRWYHHPIHGADFRNLYDSVVEEFGSLQSFHQAKNKTPNKRPGTAGTPNDSGAKRPKQTIKTEHRLNISEVPGTEAQAVLLLALATLAG